MGELLPFPTKPDATKQPGSGRSLLLVQSPPKPDEMAFRLIKRANALAGLWAAIEAKRTVSISPKVVTDGRDDALAKGIHNPVVKLHEIGP